MVWPAMSVAGENLTQMNTIELIQEYNSLFEHYIGESNGCEARLITAETRLALNL